MLTKRDIPVLEALARYFILTRRMIQSLCYENDKDGRITRRRLQALVRGKYVSKQRMLVVNPDDESPAPVYILAKAGRQFLAEHFADDSFLLKPIEIKHPQHIVHHLRVAETHITFDQAIESQENVTLEAWYNEYDVVNLSEQDKQKHTSIFTKLRDEPRKLYCAPDAAFMVGYKGHFGVFYLEQDRGHNRYDHKRVIARKSPGYIELHRRQLHKQHFPMSTLETFKVLFITENDGRRDALRRAAAKTAEPSLWRFVSRSDLKPETLLHEKILYRCNDAEPQALVKL